MNVIDKIRLNFYPELKQLNIDDDILKQIISNKDFKNQYKAHIKPFIKYLKNYKQENYDPITQTYKSVGFGDDAIKQHLKAVFELSIRNNSNKYISFIQQEYYKDVCCSYIGTEPVILPVNAEKKSKITNFNVFNDQNFEKLYDMIGDDIFSDNICEIINNGHSDRLLQFKNSNSHILLSRMNASMFDDKIWNIINQNPFIGNTNVLNLFGQRLDIFAKIVNDDLYDGLKYTYENLNESHSFIERTLVRPKEGSYSLQQFSMDFIENIGDETLKKLYSQGCFADEKNFKKIFEIASFGNYELIQDIVNYDSYNFKFENISVNDMQKNLLETNIGYYNKSEVFLNKYFGIKKNDAHYIKLFLDAINKVPSLPSEFEEKYGVFLQLANLVLSSDGEELVKLSKSMDVDKKEDYKKLITECERDGNDVLKNQFVNDLKLKNQDMIATAEHKEIMTNDGNINVYEFNGQPFTMLVHAICNNNNSEHNSFVSEIINNPENWNKIDGGNNYISTSLISDRYMKTYGVPDNNDVLMFGFNDLSWNSVKYTDVKDVGINRKASTNANCNMRRRISTADCNTIATVDDLMEKTIMLNSKRKSENKSYNEIGLSRIDEITGMKIKPNFVVCMDTISESSIKAAQHFNIPIYLINRKYYPELPYVNEDKNNLDDTQTIETSSFRR